MQLTVKKIGPEICCKASHIGTYLDSMIGTRHPLLIKKGSNTFNVKGHILCSCYNNHFFIDNSWKNVNVSYYSSLELLHHILWASICIFVKLRPLASHRALVIRKLYCFENIVLTESFNITMATNYKHILCNIAMCTLCKNLDKVYKKATGLRSERMFTLEFRILWHY